MSAPNLPPEASAVERINHLQQKICMLWAKDQLDTYLNEVLLDTRDGARQGLPVDVCSEMLFLQELNKRVRAIDLAGTLNVSLDEAYQNIDQHDRGYSVFDLQHGRPHIDNV
jgi:hypothetical protein